MTPNLWNIPALAGLSKSHTTSTGSKEIINNIQKQCIWSPRGYLPLW